VVRYENIHHRWAPSLQHLKGEVVGKPRKAAKQFVHPQADNADEYKMFTTIADLVYATSIRL